MATISTQLRNFKEPTREQLNLLFFALPPEVEHYGREAGAGELEKIEVGAILSLGVQGVEEAYVRARIDVCLGWPADAARRRDGCISSRRTSRSRAWTARACASPCHCRRFDALRGSMRRRGCMR